MKDLRAARTAVSPGRWRDSQQASDWVGKAIGQALRLDPADPKDKRRICSMLKTWKANGMFVVVEGKDAKHNTRSFVEVGEWATD